MRWKRWKIEQPARCLEFQKRSVESYLSAPSHKSFFFRFILQKKKKYIPNCRWTLELLTPRGAANTVHFLQTGEPQSYFQLNSFLVTLGVQQTSIYVLSNSINYCQFPYKAFWFVKTKAPIPLQPYTELSIFAICNVSIHNVVLSKSCF